jgi:nucleoside-diphosphate-sugar epimerase
MNSNFIASPEQPILVTGSNGFIGSKVVETLLEKGFLNVRCFVRPASNRARFQGLAAKYPKATLDFFEGNLLSRDSCKKACAGVSVVLHLAAGVDKTYAGSYLNTVVTTRNLIEGAAQSPGFKRFLLVSSFAIYSNWNLGRYQTLDENCPVEKDPARDRNESYCFAKAKQEEILREYAAKLQVPYAIVRPGAVYGPGSRQHLTPRIGIDTFGIYLHLGGGNPIPLAYVDNCAEAIVLAGVTAGVDGEVFNVVDDDLPSSRWFLRNFKEKVGHFPSITVPYSVFFLFSYFWEKYSAWSNGQLPPVFNRRRAAAYWKGNRYSNEKAKRMLNWQPKVSSREGARRHFEYFKNQKAKA